jgi:hypothetical protein
MAIKLVGADDAAGSQQSVGYFTLCRFTAEATGNMVQFRVKSSAAGNVKCAIYADSAGEPGALITAMNTGQAVNGLGWNTLNFTSTPITLGTVYWLAFMFDTQGAVDYRTLAGTARRYKAATYSTFTFPDPAGSGFSSTTGYADLEDGWAAELTISPSGLFQPISYGTPKLNLSIKPSGYQQSIAYGTPTVQTAGLIIYPSGLQVVIAYGTPLLRYPQTISPPGLNVSIAYGTPSVIRAGEGVIFVPGHQQPIAYGTPTILKYVWHVILDGNYITESTETNRQFVIGRDVYGNPVYGEAHDSDESGLVGERLDFQQELAIPTTAQAADVASAILAKMRLNKARGVILIPPNCGQELWDVVQLSDAGANQSAVKFRVVGIRFEYHPRQARYEHKLILGAP